MFLAILFFSLELAVVLLGVFSCVLLHEFGHSLAALKCGSTVHNIHLFPIGGVAQVDLPVGEPKKEFFITICGPLVNLFLAPIFLIAGALMMGEATTDTALTTVQQIGSYCLLMCLMNVVMFVFNLLPMFPMDGGRIFRSSMAIAGVPYEKSTAIAVRVGQVLAFGFGVFGIYLGAYLWFAVALLLIMGAQQELMKIRFLRLEKVRRDFFDAFREGKSHEELLQIADGMTDSYVRALMLQTVEEADS